MVVELGSRGAGGHWVPPGRQVRLHQEFRDTGDCNCGHVRIGPAGARSAVHHVGPVRGGSLMVPGLRDNDLVDDIIYGKVR